MRDFKGSHVSQVDEYRHAVDIDDVWVTTSNRGSFDVSYAAHIDKICVSVEGYPGRGRTSMQLTVEQATLLHDLVAAGIADALAAAAAELPAGGDPA